MMTADQQYRQFVLGMAGPELEAKIEEGILRGEIDSSELLQLEGELIDELIFGRLSPEEERSFREGYLSSTEGARKLAFAHALRQYATTEAAAKNQSEIVLKSSAPAFLRWTWALAAAFVCAAVAVLWLGISNFRLSQHLAKAKREQKEQQSLGASNAPPEGRSVNPKSQAVLQAAIRLSPGVSRGLATIPVLELAHDANSATLVIELPFAPGRTLHEELLNSDNKIVWSQQFSVTGGAANDGTATIVLPAAILTADDYRLRATPDPRDAEAGGTATYLFRVRRE
jgi:hypothetical protein